MSADDAARHCRSRRTSAPLSDAAIVSSRLVLRPGNRLLSPPSLLMRWHCTVARRTAKSIERRRRVFDIWRCKNSVTDLGLRRRNRIWLWTAERSSLNTMNEGSTSNMEAHDKIPENAQGLENNRWKCRTYPKKLLSQIQKKCKKQDWRCRNIRTQIAKMEYWAGIFRRMLNCHE